MCARAHGGSTRRGRAAWAQGARGTPAGSTLPGERRRGAQAPLRAPPCSRTRSSPAGLRSCSLLENKRMSLELDSIK